MLVPWVDELGKGLRLGFRVLFLSGELNHLHLLLSLFAYWVKSSTYDEVLASPDARGETVVWVFALVYLIYPI